MKPFAMMITLALVTLAAFGQLPGDTLTVQKDSRIDLLIQKQVEINEYTTRNARRTAKGFRIQVINTTDRNAAIEAKTTVYRLYPELKAYLLYQSPYFRLRVGNFETRDEAENYQRQLAREFKQNVYIVNDTIEVNPDKSGER
ncbi:SPOR domain-containing protein [Flavihumibacter sp. ZG627]|uniref:SPOR domain-containing protein n=1 Tax=Flavihumibacter sp. ZG627 TaxID=1463156 RepID=UPI00057F95C6|nr:SPOR domain-containing protein [Flavihumibacter sp. ZG627]KIC89264.1 sporulation protein [Flavihumibacter sp. ZG627]